MPKKSSCVTRKKRKILDIEKEKDLPLCCDTLTLNGICTKRFRTKKQKTDHIGKFHRYLICGGCGNTFCHASYFWVHLNLYKGCVRELPIPCTEDGIPITVWKISKNLLKKLELRKAAYLANELHIKPPTVTPVINLIGETSQNILNQDSSKNRDIVEDSSESEEEDSSSVDQTDSDSVSSEHNSITESDSSCYEASECSLEFTNKLQANTVDKYHFSNPLVSVIQKELIQPDSNNIIMSGRNRKGNNSKSSGTTVQNKQTKPYHVGTKEEEYTDFQQHQHQNQQIPSPSSSYVSTLNLEENVDDDDDNLNDINLKNSSENEVVLDIPPVLTMEQPVGTPTTTNRKLLKPNTRITQMSSETYQPSSNFEAPVSMSETTLKRQILVDKDDVEKDQLKKKSKKAVEEVSIGHASSVKSALLKDDDLSSSSGVHHQSSSSLSLQVLTKSKPGGVPTVIQMSNNSQKQLQKSTSYGSKDEDGMNLMSLFASSYAKSSVSNLTLCHNDFSFPINREVLEMWHLLKQSSQHNILNGDSLSLLHNKTTKHTMMYILEFLHTGKPIEDKMRIIEFIRGYPQEAINKTVIALLILTSLQTIKEIEDLVFIVNDVYIMSDCPIIKLIQHCCLLHILRYGKYALVKKSADWNEKIQDYFSELDNELLKNDDIIRYKTWHLEREITDLTNDNIYIGEQTTPSYKNPKYTKRILHFDDHPRLRVPDNSRNDFFCVQLQQYFRDMNSNVLKNVIFKNCEPFNPQLGQSFEFCIISPENSSTTTTTTNIQLYINPIILVLHLQIGYQSKTKTFEQIQEGVRQLIFESEDDIVYFWELLHSDSRGKDLDSSCNVDRIIELSVAFQIPRIPYFLYAKITPESPEMMGKFINVYLLAEDDSSLLAMCRLLLTNPKLITSLTVEQLINVFSRDDLQIEEWDLYTIAVYYCLKGSKDKNSVHRSKIIPVFEKIAPFIRFGIMSLEEINEVDKDNYFDKAMRLEILYFKNNITWNNHEDYQIKSSETFAKPYVKRIK